VREAASRVGAQVLVSDDLDSDKRVADTLGLEHPVCRSHVKRNVDELAEELREQLQQGELTPEGLLQNPEQLQYLVRARPRDGPEQLERMYEGYKQVPLPKQGERLSV